MIGEGLSPAARALLDAARDGMSPDAAAVRRVRSKVGGAAAAAVAGGFAVKLGIVAIVAALAAGAALDTNHDRSADAPRIELPSAHVETAVPVVRMRAAPVPIEMAPDRIRRSSAERARITPVVVVRADLAREVELIDLAMASLRRGQSTAALASIRIHATETAGAGQLAEDAAAIEIEALCRLHDPRTAAKLEEFDLRFPRSAQRSRLSATCR